MNLFELETDEQSQVASQYMARVVNEIRRAVASEKRDRKNARKPKLTQQSIANKIGTSRAVINRQMQGLENLGARRVAEILWAIGWEPHFEARKIPAEENLHPPVEIVATSIKVSPPSTTGGTVTRSPLHLAL